MTAIHPRCTRGFPVFPWFSALPVLRVSHQFCSGLPCFSALPATLLAWKRQKHSCNGKRVAQVTDDRNGEIATRGAIVPERADSESDSHVSCLNAGILKPAILTGHPRVVKCNVTGTLGVGRSGKIVPGFAILPLRLLVSCATRFPLQLY